MIAGQPTFPGPHWVSNRGWLRCWGNSRVPGPPYAQPPFLFLLAWPGWTTPGGHGLLASEWPHSDPSSHIAGPGVAVMLTGQGHVHPLPEEKDVQAQEPDQGLGHHIPSSLLTSLSASPYLAGLLSCNQRASEDNDRLRVPTSSRTVLETWPHPTTLSGHTWCPHP